MGIVARQSIATTILSYIGVVVGYINLLYLYPKFLVPEQIGALRTLQDAALLFSPFAQFGVAISVQRYFPRFGDDQRQSGAFITLMLMGSLVGFTVFSIVFLFFREAIAAYFELKAKDFIGYLSLTLWLTLILVITAVLESYARSLLKTVIPSLLRDLVIRLLFSVAVLMYFMKYLTFDQFILSTLVAHFICLLALALYLYRSGDLQLSFTWPKLDPALRIEMLRYSLFGFAGTAGMIIIAKMDSLMVAGMVGLAANAVYTTAFYMATVIEIPKRAISIVIMPLISRAFENNNMAEIQTLYRKSALNQFIVGLLLLLGIAANLDNMFALMPNGAIYQAGYAVVILVGAGKLADMFFGPSSEIIVLSKYYWFNIILLLSLAVMTIALNNLLIPRYGLVGAASGAALSLVLFNFVKFIFVWATLGLQPFNWQFFKVLSIGAVTWAASMILPATENVMVDMILRSGLMSLVYGGLVFGLKVSPDVNEVVRRVLGTRR